MKLEFLDRLRCPATGQVLQLLDAEWDGDRIREGMLQSSDGRHQYPVRNYIPRFVPAANYADNFGMQWNMFRQTQLDSFSGHPISADRFWSSTGWSPEEIRGQVVLDAGCGAGRFAEVALGAGATVVALDYSSAIDACRANLADHPNLHLVQGDIFSLPFAPKSFPYVYSLGVLQHTPDVARAFASLPRMLQPSGQLAVDFYQKSWKTHFTPYYWLRPVTRAMPKTRLFSLLQSSVPTLLRISDALDRIPYGGRHIRRLVPVANYRGELPLSDEQHREWALLDTFDWLSPQFDNPQTPETVRDWLTKAGLTDIEVEKVGHLVGRGTASA